MSEIKAKGDEEVEITARVEAGTQREAREFRDSGLEAAGDERSEAAQQAEAQRAAIARKALGL